MKRVRVKLRRTELRLALVIVLTSVIPALVTGVLARSLFLQASALWFNREIGDELDRGVSLAKDFVSAKKAGLRALGLAISRDPELETAAAREDVSALDRVMRVALERHADLFEIELWAGDGRRVAGAERGEVIDETQLRALHVELPMQLRDREGSLKLTFTTERRPLDDLENAGAVLQRYRHLESARDELYDGYLWAMLVLLVITALGTTTLGVVLARGVTKRIERLGGALRLVAAGDLSVRVPITGSDELTELAENFNHMISQVVQSRQRVEFLQRMAGWQEMAKRLAHEIKNPLTPIQLAVEECQRRYPGDDPKYDALLDTTVEIVREEVGSLRRLVEHFASFARLPAPEPQRVDLAELVRDLAAEGGEGLDVRDWPSLELALGSEKVYVTLDRQLFRRVLVNLLDNAAQAHPEGVGRARLSLGVEERRALFVIEDDGVGIPASQREQIFEPYVTNKANGTGLGLAIAKKIIVDHQGSIEVHESTLGGARFEIRLPLATS